MNNLSVAVSQPGRLGFPLDCLRNRPIILEAIRSAISHVGFIGIPIAESVYAPSSGPGSITYVYLNHFVGEMLFDFEVKRLEANGINNLVLPATSEYDELRLIFSQGYVVGERAYLHEKGPCAIELIEHNRRYLGLRSLSEGTLTLIDTLVETPKQVELIDPPSFLSVWVIWKRRPDRMEAWLIAPIDVDHERRRIGFYDMEFLGAFEHTESPQTILEKANRPESTPTPFTIEERPDGTNGSSG